MFPGTDRILYCKISVSGSIVSTGCKGKSGSGLMLQKAEVNSNLGLGAQYLSQSAEMPSLFNQLKIL